MTVGAKHGKSLVSTWGCQWWSYTESCHHLAGLLFWFPQATLETTDLNLRWTVFNHLGHFSTGAYHKNSLHQMEILVWLTLKINSKLISHNLKWESVFNLWEFSSITWTLTSRQAQLDVLMQTKSSTFLYLQHWKYLTVLHYHNLLKWLKKKAEINLKLNC